MPSTKEDKSFSHGTWQRSLKPVGAVLVALVAFATYTYWGQLRAAYNGFNDYYGDNTAQDYCSAYFGEQVEVVKNHALTPFYLKFLNGGDLFFHFLDQNRLDSLCDISLKGIGLQPNIIGEKIVNGIRIGLSSLKRPIEFLQKLAARGLIKINPQNVPAALNLSYVKENVDLITFLLNHGFDLTQKDSKNQTIAESLLSGLDITEFDSGRPESLMVKRLNPREIDQLRQAGVVFDSLNALKNLLKTKLELEVDEGNHNDVLSLERSFQRHIVWADVAKSFIDRMTHTLTIDQIYKYNDEANRLEIDEKLIDGIVFLSLSHPSVLDSVFSGENLERILNTIVPASQVVVDKSLVQLNSYDNWAPNADIDKSVDSFLPYHLYKQSSNFHSFRVRLLERLSWTLIQLSKLTANPENVIKLHKNFHLLITKLIPNTTELYLQDPQGAKAIKHLYSQVEYEAQYKQHRPFLKGGEGDPYRFIMKELEDHFGVNFLTPH